VGITFLLEQVCKGALGVPCEHLLPEMSKRASREGAGPASGKGAVSDPAATNSREELGTLARSVSNVCLTFNA